MMSTLGSPLCPFTLSAEPMAAMLNFEIADDPFYAGFEVQRFDDATHGAGTVVLLVRRHDRRVDVYRQPGLRLDPASYVINGGVGEWLETGFEVARVDVTATGVDVDIDFLDVAGRRIEVRLDDRDGTPRDPAALLAPVGAAIEEPNAMLLVWMPRFDLVRTNGPEPVIRIDGRDATIGRLPGAWLHRRRLIKVASDLVVVRLNPAQDGPLEPIDAGISSGLALEPAADGSRITTLTVKAAGAEAHLSFEPAVPDLDRLADGGSTGGSWALGIAAASSVVHGEWTAQRAGDEVELVFDRIAEWRPGRLPLLMRIVTRVVPTFRRWPATYRWRGTLTLASPPVLRSGWERIGTGDADAYRRVMRT